MIRRETLNAVALSIAGALLFPVALAYGAWIIYDCRRRRERERRDRRVS
ncbi:MAG: hypothetical protein WC700_17130 [Gemmatimonadaceae bacterium]